MAKPCCELMTHVGSVFFDTEEFWKCSLWICVCPWEDLLNTVLALSKYTWIARVCPLPWFPLGLGHKLDLHCNLTYQWYGKQRLHLNKGCKTRQSRTLLVSDVMCWLYSSTRQRRDGNMWSQRDYWWALMEPHIWVWLINHSCFSCFCPLHFIHPEHLLPGNGLRASSIGISCPAWQSPTT